MNPLHLTKVYKFFGILGLLFIFGSIMVELDFFSVRNDDELFFFGLWGALISFLTFLISLGRKTYLYGGTIKEKILLVLGALSLLIIIFLILIFSTLNINMI